MNNTVVSHPTQPRASHLRKVLRNHSRVVYRDAILAAAETILLRDGFRRTKMTDVAEATGVSVGTLYNYFESKEAVLQAIMDQLDLRLDDQLNLAFDSNDPTQQLAQLIVRVHGFVEEHRELFLLYSRAEFDRQDSPKVAMRVSPRSVFERVSPRIRALLEQCTNGDRLRTDIPLEVIIWSIQSMLQALLLDWYRNPNRFSLTHRGGEVVTLFIAGAASR